MVSKELFELAVLASTRIEPKNVIGTKSEYRVHGALKYYFQPDDRFHEVNTEGFICDAVSEDGSEIFEIQTRGLNRLRSKIERLTVSHTLTVIHPIITEKRIYVTYAESGEASVRKSPKRGFETDIFGEIYSIREHLTNPSLRIKLVLIKCDEFRVYAGSKESRKPFAKPISIERIPTELIEIIDLGCREDYLRFIPQGLPREFGQAEFSRLGGIPRSGAGLIINPLISLGLIEKAGKRGRAYLYRLCDIADTLKKDEKS